MPTCNNRRGDSRLVGILLPESRLSFFCIIGGTENLSLKLVVGHCRHWYHVRVIFFWGASMNKSRVDPVRNEYFYSVLNVPTTASANEIRERYRALSVIFHPDKQRGERTKDTAAVEFLEIQKAYEVLSDPFLREVYDFLGEDALKNPWPTELRSQSVEQVRHFRSACNADLLLLTDTCASSTLEDRS